MKKFEAQLGDLIVKAQQPLNYCPLCGLKTRVKTSFKGRSMYRNKRKTEVCACGWSNIICTEREAENELGLLD